MASMSPAGGSEPRGSGAARRVLSIQSHVVSGYVGNKAAVFPLQLLGFDVDVVNSVQFSNHTGYPSGWEGDVIDGTALGRLVQGMERNGLLSGGRIGHVLTGYIGSESFLRAVVGVVEKLKGLDSRCRYVCDPVLGDMGRFYVPEGLVDIYRRDVLPLADVITPNQFEVEQLTGITIRSIEDARRACSALHDFGVSLVLITSIVLPAVGEDDGRVDDSIGMFASRRREEVPDDDEQYVLYTPKFPGQFTGTGDICAALLLAWTADNSENGDSSLACSLEKLAGTMNAIVERTANAAAKAEQTTPSGERARAVASRELRLIQSQNDILCPPQNFRAERVQRRAR